MRKKMALLSCVLLGLAGTLAAVALAGQSASPMEFSAKLNSRQEVPNPRGVPVRAGGSFTAKLTGTTLTWKLTFSHLSGAAVAAHIHSGAKRKAGPVIVPLCGPCKTTSAGSAKVSTAVAKKLQSGDTYVNVHTSKNPNGEIRGQLGM
jgi:CHRD domain-containing protein